MDDVVLLAGGLVLCRNVQDAVGIDVEGNFDLWEFRCWWNAGQVELAKELIVGCHLLLVDLRFDLVLVVRRGAEYLPLLCRDGSVARDQAGEDAAKGLDPKAWGSRPGGGCPSRPL